MAYFTINGYDSYSGCDIVVTGTLPLKTKDDEEVYFTLGSLQTLSISTHQDKRPVRSLGNINAKDYVMGQRTIAGSLVFAVFDRHFADKIMKSVEVTMADEIPALNLTINFANEYGRSSVMRIYGVKLINEGQVMSINDLYTENTYQFVALGMEPLTADDPDADESTNKKLPTDGVMVIDPTTVINGVIEDKDFQNSSGKVISDKIKNNPNYLNKTSIVLSSSVEQPIKGETTGIVTLKLTPVQQEGNIYITDLLSGNDKATIQVNGSEAYNTELPIGYYNARYMNTTRTRESNVEKIIIKTSDNNEKAKNGLSLKDVYPVVESITNNSITISISDNSFNNVICFTNNDQSVTQTNNKSSITFNDLKDDTVYNVYAVNNDNSVVTNMISIKTFEDRDTYFNKFKEYISTNKDLLYNDYESLEQELNDLLAIDSDRKKYWPYDNILDGISSLNNSSKKQELLLYAMSFENSMLQAYNSQNPHKINFVRNDVFDMNLSVPDWDTVKYFSKKDNKNKFEGVLTNGEMFNGTPNKTYSFYGTSDNISSIKQYVSVFTSEGKEILNKYRESEKYKTLDISYYKSTYPTLNNEELYALTIRDNVMCDRPLLEEPYVYIGDDYNIYANVNYDDKIILDQEYYLSVSEMYSTLDIIPKRKMAFNRKTKILNISDYYVPLDPEKIYHFWVENSQGNIISKTFIFNYKQSIGLITAAEKELMNILTVKKQLLSDVISNPTALNDIIHNLYCESVPKKDLDTRLEYLLLEYGVNSYYVTNALKDYLYQAVLVNVSKKLEINRSNTIQIFNSINNLRVISGSDLDTKVLTKSYNLVDQEVVCNIYNQNSLIDIKGDYMAVFLINEYLDSVLGFIVLDCNKLQYEALGFNVKVGDN